MARSFAHTKFNDPMLGRLIKQVESFESRKQIMIKYRKNPDADFPTDFQAPCDQDCIVHPTLCPTIPIQKIPKTFVIRKIPDAERELYKKYRRKHNLIPYHAPVYYPGTPIRVCTPANLLVACPKPAALTKVPPKPTRSVLKTTSMFGLKAIIISWICMKSLDSGIWSTAERSEEFWRRMKRNFGCVEDYSQQNVVIGFERMFFILRDSYNRTAISATTSLMKLTGYIVAKINGNEPIKDKASKNEEEDILDSSKRKIPKLPTHYFDLI